MWIVFALLGALSKSFSTVARKTIIGKTDPLSAVTAIQIVSFIVLLVIASFSVSIGDIWLVVTNSFFLVVAIAATGVFAQYYLLRAFELEDISSVVPLFSFIPIVNFLLSSIVFGEIPGLIGIFGSLLVLVGAYYVYIDATHIKWFDPFLAIARSKAARLALIPILMWGIGPIIDKYAVNVADLDILAWATSVMFFMMITFIILYIGRIIKRKEKPSIKFSTTPFAIVAGGGEALAYYFGILALSAAYIGYAQSLRRFDIIFTLILSAIFLKDTFAIGRLKGASIMVLGAVIVGLS